MNRQDNFNLALTRLRNVLFREYIIFCLSMSMWWFVGVVLFVLIPAN